MQFPHLKLDKVTKGGLRGVIATKDFKAGDVIAHIPNKCTIDVGHYTLPGAVSDLLTAPWPADWQHLQCDC